MMMDLFDYAEQHLCNVAAPVPHITCQTPANLLPDDLQRIVSLLSNCIGSGQGITASEIARRLNIRQDSGSAAAGTYVRSLLSRHFRDLPFTICASPASGYFRPATSDELTHYRRDLHSRAREILTRLRDLKTQARAEGLL